MNSGKCDAKAHHRSTRRAQWCRRDHGTTTHNLQRPKVQREAAFSTVPYLVASLTCDLCSILLSKILFKGVEREADCSRFVSRARVTKTGNKPVKMGFAMLPSIALVLVVVLATKALGFVPLSSSRGIKPTCTPLVLNTMSEDASVQVEPSESSLTYNQTMANGANTAAFQPLSDKPALSTFDITGLDPASIEIVEMETTEVSKQAQDRMFVNMFRGSANYIANHRNTVAVYHIPGGLLDSDDPNLCRDLMNDIALTWLLGMKIVLVVGCRHQIDKRLKDRQTPNGLHVTDQNALRVVKEEAGYVRFEVERQLARALRLHGGTSKENNDGNVVSGNFYSAQPFGILNGVDYMYTGFVRRVEVDKIRQVHNGHDICLLTTLGVSPSGEVFNVDSESLAACVAGALGASKIIFFTEQNIVVRSKDHGGQVQHLRVTDARNLLAYNEVEVEKRGIVQLGKKVIEQEPAVADVLRKVGYSNVALDAGVKRAHIIAPTHGSVLQELYTRDGSGTLISRDLYEGIRRATVDDISGICDLIQPLIQAGTLVDRPRARMEQEIDSYYVYTRENLVVACAQLKRFENSFAEIGCLVVSKDYRSQGRGDAMLGYLERICLKNNVKDVFVLSTQTMEWFVERGFDMVDVPRLPPSRQATYNWDRNSKIYMKHIDGDRELDASELWWNR